jgi:NTE family protein
MAENTKALVLSGGGTAGGAWMLGMIHALRDQGIDLADADLIVGTSPGARTGACLATGGLDRAVAMYSRSKLPRLEVPVFFSAFVTAVMGVLTDTADRQEAVRRIANFEPLGATLASEEDRRRMVAAHLPANEWPRTRLEIVAVEADSGLRVTFDAASGVRLLDAITASGALPGIFPLVTINGKRYADGGVHSPYNVDLAAGHDIVVVLTPMATADPNPKQLLEAEIATLGEAGVHVITANESSLVAIGSNPLSSETATAALEAGAAQAAHERDALKNSWQP